MTKLEIAEVIVEVALNISIGLFVATVTVFLF